MSFAYAFIGLGLAIGKVTEKGHPDYGTAWGMVHDQPTINATWNTFNALGGMAFAYSFVSIPLARLKNDFLDLLSPPWGNEQHLKFICSRPCTPRFFYASRYFQLDRYASWTSNRFLWCLSLHSEFMFPLQKQLYTFSDKNTGWPVTYVFNMAIEILTVSVTENPPGCSASYW